MRATESRCSMESLHIWLMLSCKSWSELDFGMNWKRNCCTCGSKEKNWIASMEMRKTVEDATRWTDDETSGWFLNDLCSSSRKFFFQSDTRLEQVASTEQTGSAEVDSSIKILMPNTKSYPKIRWLREQWAPEISHLHVNTDETNPSNTLMLIKKDDVVTAGHGCQCDFVQRFFLIHYVSRIRSRNNRMLCM